MTDDSPQQALPPYPVKTEHGTDASRGYPHWSDCALRTTSMTTMQPSESLHSTMPANVSLSNATGSVHTEGVLSQGLVNSNYDHGTHGSKREDPKYEGVKFTDGYAFRDGQSEQNSGITYSKCNSTSLYSQTAQNERQMDKCGQTTRTNMAATEMDHSRNKVIVPAGK